MSAINNNPLATGFAPTNAAFDFERPASNAFANAMIPSVRERADLIRFQPTTGLSFLSSPAPGGGSAGGGFGNPGTSDTQSGFAGLMNSLLTAISNVFGQLGSLFNFANNSPPQAPPSAQNYYTNATASSVGDPHETFAGTTSAGQNVGGHWDSMTSHNNLLSSDSFDGGYRVSTAVTQPGSNGVTLNERVSVATNGGQSNVTMNKDGSYDVRSYGRVVALEQGHAVALNSGETVTLNADKSLMIDDSNGRGGSVETSLRTNGSGGVDVNTTAKHVDLGGYLVSRSDGDPSPVPGLPIFQNFAPASQPGMATSANLPFSAQPFDPNLPFNAQPFDPNMA